MRGALARWAVCLLTLLPASGCMFGSASPLRPLEEALLFHPSCYPEGDWEATDLVHEDVWFRSNDGTRLHGWYCPAENPRAVMLYCHGNAGSVADRKWIAKLLQEKLGVTVFIFDYRGYGRSEGTPDEDGILADAESARRWLAQRAGIAESDVVLLGHSLGGAVAVQLSTSGTPYVPATYTGGVGLPPIVFPVVARGLILENTFPSLREVAARNLWPLHWCMSMNLNSAEKIRDYRGPLLQTHGTADRLIPFDLAQKLFAAANDPKWFIPVEGGGHNDPPSLEYIRALDEFLNLLPPVKGSAR